MCNKPFEFAIPFTSQLQTFLMSRRHQVLSGTQKILVPPLKSLDHSLTLLESRDSFETLPEAILIGT